MNKSISVGKYLLCLSIIATVLIGCLNHMPVRAAEPTAATSSDNIIWANGSYKLKYLTLSTSLKATSYKKKSNTVKGKIKWIVCNEKTEPLIEKYVLKTKNTGSKIASVAVVKADTVKVCAKRGGTAYIYAVDLGSGKFEEFVVTVKEAPSKLEAYVDTEKQTSVFSVYVNTVDEKKIYIKEIPSDKKLKIDPDCTYTVKAQTKKNSEHFEVGTVQRDSEGRPYFTVRAKDIVKNGYFIYRIYNDQSGQYAAVRVHTVNPLVDIYGKADKDNINKKGEVMTVNIDLILKDKNQPSGDSFTAIAMTDDPKFNKGHTTYSYHAAKSVRATVSKDGTKITITVIKDITEPITIRLMRRDAETKSVFPHYIKTLYPENWKPNDSQNKTEP